MGVVEDRYRLMLQKLLPRGPAWTREPSAELTALLQGLAGEPARVDARALDLLEEYDPRTTDELLPDWERVAGLPGLCQAPAGAAERRELLHQRLLGHGDPNLGFWQEQAEALGFTFYSVEEYRPMVAGFAAGDHVIGTAWIFAWTISLSARTAALNTLMQCTIEQLYPLHTEPLTRFALYSFWEIETPDASYTGDFTSVAHDGSATYCAVGQSAEIQTSPDGEAWTHRTPAGAYAGNFNAVASYGAAKFVAVGTSAELQRSVDSGASWVADAPAGGFGGWFRGVAWNGTVIVAVGQTAEIQKSVGGGVWLARSADAGFAGDFRTAAADTSSGIIVIAGASGEIQWSDDDGDTWNHADSDRSYTGFWQGSSFANGYFWLVGASGEVQQSEDGQSWRRITNDKTGIWWGVYGDGDEGIILVGDSKYLRVRTRIGPEMLFETRTAPAGSDDPFSVVVYSETAVVVGVNGLIWQSPKYGS